jgi:hypothetical protein
MKRFLVISSDILPYGKDIAKSLSTSLSHSVCVEHLEINTSNLLYFLSRKHSGFKFLRSYYAKTLLTKIFQFNPDYILNFFGPCPFSPSDFKLLRKKLNNLKIFSWFIDVLDYDKELFTSIAFESNFVGMLSADDLDTLRPLIKKSPFLESVVHLPCFYNEKVFFNDKSGKKIDVFFVGSWSHHRMKNRRKSLSWLAQISKKYNLKTVIVARSSLKEPFKFLIDLFYGVKFLRYIKPGPLFGHGLAKYYRNSRFIIECPADNQLDANPMRSYEALACGSSILFYGKSSKTPALPFYSCKDLERILCLNFSDEKSYQDLLPENSVQSNFLRLNSLQSRIDLICKLLIP